MNNNQWSRSEKAEKMAQFEAARQNDPTTSQRQLAEELQIPRTTLQYWLKQKETIDADPELISFFESPVGVGFLHRLVLGAHFTMTQLGPCSPRLVSQYLELTGLNQFVAASYSAQRKVTVSMEKAIMDFGKEEEKRLAAGMSPKEITVCQDEMFKNAVYLVAIDPVSNMILLEVAAPNRTADEWTKAMEKSVGHLPVKIIQSTSDEAAGIRAHVKNDLGAHHSPDLFHVQQDVVKGMYPALGAKTRQAGEELQKAKVEVNRLEKEQLLKNEEQGQHQSKNGENRDLFIVDSNSPLDDCPEKELFSYDLVQVSTNVELLPQKELSESMVSETTCSAREAANESEKKEPSEGVEKESQKELETTDQQNSTSLSTLQLAIEAEAQAQANLLEAQNRQNSAKSVVEGINLAYHPYNLDSGEERSSEVVSEELTSHFNEALQIAKEANLSDSSIKKIKKAQRVIPLMVATIAFFFLTIRTKIRALALAEEVEEAVFKSLIPGIYLSIVSEKTTDIIQRDELRNTSKELLATLTNPESSFSTLSYEERLEIERVARECAELFQRSSSCVEGRNGQLALRYHCWHRLGERKIGALTTIHNYYIKRPDQTTAAERFFGQKPKDLFLWLLERVDLPGRPAKKRRQP